MLETENNETTENDSAPPSVDDAEVELTPAKRQGELAGFERETDEELDEILGPLRDARLRAREYKQEEDRLRALAIQKLDEKSMDKYVYFDGEEEFDVSIVDRISLSMRKRTEG